MVCRGAVSLLLLSLLLVSVPASAQWIENGTPYTGFAGEITARRAVPDGYGGILVLTGHTGASGPGYLFLERIDGYGRLIMTAHIDGPGAFGSRLAADGAGGAIVAAVKGNDLYAYRVDAAGSLAWGAGGVLVSGAGDTLASPSLAADGAGGCFVVWQDMRTDAGDIYAQHILDTGAAGWAGGGVAVCDTALTQREPSIVADPAGGILVAWSDMRDSLQYDIYAARLSASGAPEWTGRGVEVCGAPGDQGLPQAASAGIGGAFIAWIDERDGNEDIYAQRLDGSGTAAWSAGGIEICVAGGAQNGFGLSAADSYNEFLLAWTDRRSGGADIYVQKILSGGTPAWIAGGYPVCLEAGDQTSSSIAPDGLGGALVTWRDGRTDPEPDIYIQHMDASGFAKWESGGRAVCDLPGAQTDPAMAADGEGGALVSWAGPDPADPSSFISFCQRIERNGYWGYPAPTIFAVRDVPGDQGGFVNLAWDASRLDPWPYSSILNYSVWRAISPTDALAMLDSGARKLVGLSAVEPDSDIGQIRIEQAGGTAFYWEFINYVYAASLEHYADIVATAFDSTAVCDEHHYFQVVAHSTDANAVWLSAPDSGRSVDNLAPAMPCSLVARQWGDDLRISWRPNTEPDLSHYALYRGESADFVPGEPVCVLADTAVVDTSWSPDANDDFYKLVALDIHGNASGAALVTPSEVVATLLQFYASRLLGQNILVEWRLSEIDAGATFRISRRERGSGDRETLEESSIIRDGLSFSCLDNGVEPGRSYIYTIEYSGGSGWKILFETEEISVPAAAAALFQNHPNPFNPSTTIRYYLPEEGRVTIDIVDVAGRKILTLFDGSRESGHHEARWNGVGGSGRPVSSGVYFCVMRSGRQCLTRKMTLLR